MDGPVQTALGSARTRFIEGLPRRSEELRAASEQIEAAPEAEPLREEMRRRLHALYATAQVFRAEVLALAVESVIARLDAARSAARTLDATDLEALYDLADRLPLSVPAEEEPLAPHVASTASEPVRPSHIPSSAAQRAVTQTVAGFLSAPAQTCVLVVDSAAVQARVRTLLPADSFELCGATDAAEAITMSQQHSPDFVLVSGELASFAEEDLVRRLQSDPLSQVRATYVLLPRGATYDAEFLRQTGADGVLVEPLDAAQLVSLVQAHTATPRRAFDALADFSEGTAAEIAGRVAEEIRRGIAESLKSGRNERIKLDDPNDLMAVAWSAIGKIRVHLAEQSRGRVRFRDESLQDAPTLLTLAASQSAATAADGGAAPKLDASVLSGRRVLVADDDPAVLWFFSGLLREVGAQVIEAQNGQQALELARRKRPQVVISDILMPKIDGFALCRELKRDVLLSHVPVILLSWKEDFLQRMRELDAGASGYLRKEAGSQQILNAIVEALGPRLRMSALLGERAEVRGRVEPLGILPLLETIASERPDASLSVRDAWNLFDVEIRGGSSLSVTRTAADGAFARGEKALVQLLGVAAGRFSLASSDAPLREPLEQALERALSDAAKELGALLDAVSATRLMHVALIAFDDEVVASLLSATPTPLAEVVARFRAGGTSAKQLLVDGLFTPGDLETNLRELARRGAISGVWNDEGEDLVAAAKREREDRPGTLMHSSNPPRISQPLVLGVVQALSDPSALSSEAAGAAPSALAVLEADPPVVFGAAESAQLAAASSNAITLPASGPAPAPTSAASSASAAQQRQSALPPPLPGAPGKAWLRLAFTLAALFALGYWGYFLVAGAKHSAPAAAAPAQAPVAVAPVLAAVPAPRAVVEPSPAAPVAIPRTDTAPDDTHFGRVLPFIDQSHRVAVGPEEGLLVVEPGEGQAPELRVGDRELGRPPLAIALPAGRHELVLRRDGDTSFRYLIIRAGETRVLTLTAPLQ